MRLFASTMFSATLRWGARFNSCNHGQSAAPGCNGSLGTNGCPSNSICPPSGWQAPLRIFYQRAFARSVLADERVNLGGLNLEGKRF